MRITKDVVLDLLPVYFSGEASAATRALVEEFLSGDPALAERVRKDWQDNLAAGAPVLPPELELASLRRTRSLLRIQRWIFGLAIGFTAAALSCRFAASGGHVTEFDFLIREYPMPFGASLLAGLVCWVSYFILLRRLRLSAP
jgi:anti-sigma factor RsiW